MAAINLNLLPPEYSVSGPLGKSIKLIKSLNVIFLAVFLVFVLSASAFFLISSLSLKNMQSQEDGLKSQISAQETSEQQIVLLKDRLGKIKTLNSQNDNSQIVAALDPEVGSLPGSATLSDLSISSQKTEIAVIFSDANDFSSFLKGLTNSQKFKSIVLTSFGLNPLSGYLVSLKLL